MYINVNDLQQEEFTCYDNVTLWVGQFPRRKISASGNSKRAGLIFLTYLLLIYKAVAENEELRQTNVPDLVEKNYNHTL